MRDRAFGAGTVLLWCGLAVLSCAGGDRAVTRYNAPGAETVSIGAVYPASLWNDDHYLRDALELAVDQVNQNGGVLGKPLSLVIRDDYGDSHVAQEIAETFSDAGITAVVGHWTSEVCYYVEDIYEEREIVMISPGATSLALFEQDYQYIYRTIANNQIYAETLADYAEAEGFRRPAIYYAEDTYGIDVAQLVERELAKRRIPVMDRVTSVTPANVEELLRRWRAFGCDSVVLASSIQYVAEPIQILRNAGCRLPFFSETFNNVNFQSAVADYMEDIYGIMYSREDMDTTFLADFRAAYGRTPDTYEVAGYEAVRLLADAMNTEGSITSAAIVHYLRNLRDYPSAIGRISYNAAAHEFEGHRMRVRPYVEYEAR
ncbi:MAG: ABC transporter substrate-binding protein [Treponema sp.]|jgi:branched-chain amino acid transport system substrate-binding protein|nr:ABC transporter substrate-binding protein [Treponema sp.]